MARRLSGMWLNTAVVVGLAVIAGLVGLLVDSYWIGVVSQALMMGLAAVALDVLVGWSGMPSLGQAAFFGTAAYTMAVLATRYEMNPWVAALIGIVAGVALSALFAPLVVRTHGLAFLTVTLAFGQCIWGIATKWTDVTGGSDGISGLPRPDGPFGISMYDPKVFYVFTLVVVAVCVIILIRVLRSPFGLQLQGVRLSELRLRSLGYNATRVRMAAFVISSLFVAVAGVLFTFFNQFVGTNTVDWKLSASMLLAVVVGGPGTIWGPFVAGFGLFFVQVLATGMTDRWTMILGLLYILAVLFLPKGIAGLAKSTGSRLARKGPRISVDSASDNVLQQEGGS